MVARDLKSWGRPRRISFSLLNYSTLSHFIADVAHNKSNIPSFSELSVRNTLSLDILPNDHRACHLFTSFVNKFQTQPIEILLKHVTVSLSTGA